MTASLEAVAGQLLDRLFPICRSITGEGVRETLAVLREVVDFEIHEVPSGTHCYDWVVPDEWSIRDAYIADSSGRRLVDFRRSNLHVVGYSVPVDVVQRFEELDPHLHTLPATPTAIPYRTSYYERTWGFCLPHDTYLRLDRDESFHVVIDSDLKPGSLTYGEARIEGTSGHEYLFSTYCCHPSLANDNLSGVVLWTLLLAWLRQCDARHSYRFVIVPETIGAIAYLAANEEEMRRVEGGFVITTVAGPGPFGYKRTFGGDSVVDHAAEQAFVELGHKYVGYEFSLGGSDERQYSSPFFRIPMATIAKDKYQEYDEYHTSLDDLGFIRPANLLATLEIYERTIEILEANRSYRSLTPYCEPMLGRRGLYPPLGGTIKQRVADPERPHEARAYDLGDGGGKTISGNRLDAMLWTMFYGDGETSLLDIARRTGLPVSALAEAAAVLQEHGLLEPAADDRA